MTRCWDYRVESQLQGPPGWTYVIGSSLVLHLLLIRNAVRVGNCRLGAHFVRNRLHAYVHGARRIRIRTEWVSNEVVVPPTTGDQRYRAHGLIACQGENPEVH